MELMAAHDDARARSSRVAASSAPARPRRAARSVALLVSVAASVLAALVPVGAASASEREARRALVGREAPDFTQRVLGGGNFRLSERRGEVVLLGFWTSWCGGCREHLERLARLDATYGSAGLVVVGVSLDDDPQRAAELREAVAASFRNVLDSDKRLGREYRVNDLPMIVLIDRAGTVRHVHGEVSRRGEGALLEEIRRLLDE